MKIQLLLAKAVITLIPASCPFAWTLKLRDQQVVIPPLCKLNPFYNDLMALRFWALCLLAKE